MVGIARDWPAGHPTRGATKRNACSNCTAAAAAKLVLAKNCKRRVCRDMCVCVCRYFLNSVEVPLTTKEGKKKRERETSSAAQVEAGPQL